MKRIYLLLLLLMSTLSDTFAQQNETLHNGLILSRIKGKYGFKNSSGRMVIPAVYDAAFAFSEGLTPVKKNRKWFYIDTLGKAAHTDDKGKPTLFSMARPYFHGLAVVRYANNYIGRHVTFIDAGGGAAFVDFSADALTDMAPGFSIVRQGKKYQIVNTCLDYLLPDEYDHIDSFSNGYARVILDGNTIYLNPYGLCVKNCENMQRAELRESTNPELLYLSNVGLYFSDQSKVKIEALASTIRQYPDKKYVVESYGNSSYATQQNSWECANKVIRVLTEQYGLRRDQFIFQFGQQGRYRSVKVREALSGEDGPTNVPPPFSGYQCNSSYQ